MLGRSQRSGLKAQPDTGDNGVHASASPLEALAERSNWLRASVSKDAFGALSGKLFCIYRSVC